MKISKNKKFFAIVELGDLKKHKLLHLSQQFLNITLTKTGAAGK